MLEHLSIDSQPSVGVSHKLVEVIDGADDFKIEILQMIAFSGSNSLNLPLIGAHTRNTDKCLHLVSFPVDQEECVLVGLKLRYCMD